MRPRPVARELAQELGRVDRDALAADGVVLEVGEVGLDELAEARVHRPRPGVVAARLAGRDDLVAPGVVVREHACVEIAHRAAHRTGERGQVDDVRGALLARVDERVGEHEPALGVGVRDLDRLAVRGRENVAGAEAAAAHDVLGRGDDRQDADR